MSNLVKIDYKLPSVSFGKDELKEIVAEQVAPLKGFHTEDDMKKGRAELRKIIATYDNQRKDITRQWDDTKKAFMADVKDALQPAVDLETEYADGLSEIEQERRTQKYSDIMKLDGAQQWNEHHDMPDEWLNKSFSRDDIAKRIKNDLHTLNEHRATIKKTCSLVNIPHVERYLDMLKSENIIVILERINEDAMLLRTKDEPKITGEVPAQEVPYFIAAFNAYDVIADASSKRYTRTRTLTMTKAQATLMKHFCDTIGIEIEKVNE